VTCNGPTLGFKCRRVRSLFTKDRCCTRKPLFASQVLYQLSLECHVAVKMQKQCCSLTFAQCGRELSKMITLSQYLLVKCQMTFRQLSECGVLLVLGTEITLNQNVINFNSFSIIKSLTIKVVLTFITLTWREWNSMKMDFVISSLSQSLKLQMYTTKQAYHVGIFNTKNKCSVMRFCKQIIEKCSPEPPEMYHSSWTWSKAYANLWFRRKSWQISPQLRHYGQRHFVVKRSTEGCQSKRPQSKTAPVQNGPTFG